MKHGYTLVELMIIISIVGILVSFGISSYGKVRDRQKGLASVEQVLTVLQENQTAASIGKSDCEGRYLGQQVVLSGSGNISSRSICQGGDPGSETSIQINGITSLSPATTMIFHPLTKGINLATNPLYLNIASENGLTYRIMITSSGIIESQGTE